MCDLLLIDDNIDDIELTKKAFELSDIKTNISVSENGKAALERLRDKSIPHPDMIFLDINMPVMNGLKFLQTLKEDKDLCYLPVIVLTTSNAEIDILKAYKLKANCFVSKPINFKKFISIIQAINEFWLKIARLPKWQRGEEVLKQVP